MNHDNLDQQQVDEKFMKMAIKLAEKAEALGEVPIGALIVDKSGKIMAKATNLRETKSTALGHAELVAIHRANQKLGSWRLIDCTLYVTLEPCYMCAGALVQSRIARVVYGAKDPKGGALESLDTLGAHRKLNHQFEVSSAVCEEECSVLLKNFFKAKRKSKA
ncbi:MAG: tRNA adenosine(34) deaminase TadA [Pseudobdellovibrio sp.]